MLVRQENLAFRNATEQDAAVLGNWWRDGKVMEHAGFPNGLNITDEQIAAGISTDSDETRRRMVIELEGSPIGEMNYSNEGNHTAEIGIKICDSSKQEKGYGTRILIMLIKYLFYEQGYEKIILDTNLKNTRAQHVYEKIGFRKVRIRHNSWRDQLGRPQSTVYYEMTKDSFISAKYGKTK